MKDLEVIGVVGAAGDLGGQLCVQSVAVGYETIVYARNGHKIQTISGIDLVTRIRNINDKVVWSDSIKELLERSDIVHWCVPLDALKEIDDIPASVKLVLHDSVMSRSRDAKAKLLERFPDADIAIVHCLMNNDTMIVQAIGHTDGIGKHIKQLGMRTKQMDIVDHDTLMAHTQAPLAILCKLLLDDLNQHHADGLLTNSGQALRKSLIDRSAHWTEATYEAILSNPELPRLIKSMQKTIDRYKV